MTGDASFQIVSGQGFGPKEQGGGGAELSLSFPILTWLSVGTSFGLSETLPSDTTGGFVYRGYGTGALGACVEAHGPIGQWRNAGTLDAGGRVGVAADWSAYQYTSLFFFYPETLVEGFLGFRFAGLPSLQFRLALPFRVQFRRDLDYSLSAAVGLGAVYTFGGT